VTVCSDARRAPSSVVSEFAHAVQLSLLKEYFGVSDTSDERLLDWLETTSFFIFNFWIGGPIALRPFAPAVRCPSTCTSSCASASPSGPRASHRRRRARPHGAPPAGGVAWAPDRRSPRGPMSRWSHLRRTVATIGRSSRSSTVSSICRALAQRAKGRVIHAEGRGRPPVRP